MTRDSMEAMPMSPRGAGIPTKLMNVALLYLRSRRGRVVAISAVFMVFLLGLAGMRHSNVSTRTSLWRRDCLWVLDLYEQWTYVSTKKKHVGGRGKC